MHLFAFGLGYIGGTAANGNLGTAGTSLLGAFGGHVAAMFDSPTAVKVFAGGPAAALAGELAGGDSAAGAFRGAGAAGAIDSLPRALASFRGGAAATAGRQMVSGALVPGAAAAIVFAAATAMFQSECAAECTRP
jgi:hypothetical protein